MSETELKEMENTTYQPCGKVVVRKIGGDVLLVPVSGPAAGGRVFPINDSALVVWNSLTEGEKVCAAAGKLVREYGIDEKMALADSRECVERFVAEKLLEEKRID